MAKRYELAWEKIEHVLPGKKRDPGRTAQDNRLFLNAVLWVLRSGAFWIDLPERRRGWSRGMRSSKWTYANNATCSSVIPRIPYASCQRTATPHYPKN
ncbi:transposase [Vampirovibrio sp.]|uniref:transposase n=1 Tax=Vampirovibrio sp. TaxID=2717857 RepID=UPI0035938E75